METLGDKIKQLRNKLTQEELAILLQVDRSTLASWEINRREPDITTLCRIATFFNVSVDWLVGNDFRVPDRNSFIQEPANVYLQNTEEEAWQKVIVTAQHYGFDPDTVDQLISFNVQIAQVLQKGNK